MRYSALANYRARLAMVPLCSCGQPATRVRRTKCDACYDIVRNESKARDLRARRQRAYRLRLKVAGQCRSCSRPSLDDSLFCEQHNEAHRDDVRAQYRERRGTSPRKPRRPRIPPMPREQFARIVREHRIRRGYETQAELARRVGVSRLAVSTWERGLHIPHLPMLERVLRVLKVSMEVRP